MPLPQPFFYSHNHFYLSISKKHTMFEKTTYSTVAALLVTVALSGCVTMTGSNAPSVVNTPIASGEAMQVVKSRLGQPVDSQVFRDSVALTFCDDGFIYNDLLVVWFREQKVVQTFRTSNDELGSCLNGSTVVNWADTYASGALVFQRNHAREARRAALNEMNNRQAQSYNNMLQNILQQPQQPASGSWQVHQNGRTYTCSQFGTQVTCQ